MSTIKNLIRDLEVKNYYKVFNSYLNEFEARRGSFTITAIKDLVLFRTRVGHHSLKGAIDDLNIEVSAPYFANTLGAPPPLHSIGGRFNRMGCSFLYLASNIETCIAEIKLEVGQICSAGQFRCISNESYIDFRESTEDNFLKDLTNYLCNRFIMILSINT